jgi:hypothetical protein
MILDARISRRRFLQLGAGAAAGALLLPVLPETARAGTLVDPYSGSIPLVFPLVYGTYKTPVQDNWHVNREGQIYTWNHRNGSSQRAHDGVDVYPSSRRKLPRVYAPLSGKVAAVCVRSSNTVNATVTYKASSKTPLPGTIARRSTTSSTCRSMATSSGSIAPKPTASDTSSSSVTSRTKRRFSRSPPTSRSR